MRIKKGDSVIILAGKDKGSKGKVLKVMETRVLVEGINVWKKHTKRTSLEGKGKTVDVTRSIHASNVVPVDPKSGKGTRVGSKMVAGKRVRVASKSGQEL